MLHSADMGRPKKYDHPPNMTFDRSSGRWVVRNPETGKTKKFSDQGAAERAVKALNELLDKHRKLDAVEYGRPTIGGLVEKWEQDKLQFMPWDPGTRSNMLAKMRRIARELGLRTIRQTDCMYLEDWLGGFCKTADQFNKWRYALVLLWRFAVSRKLADACEAEKIEPRSTSKKLEANQKRREQLDIEGFRLIHERAEPWLKIAMEQSLVTLQARLEICNMRHADYRDGYLFVIREKVSGDSDMAFIKIAVTAQLEDIRSRSRATDNTVSPFIVHRRAVRTRREWLDARTRDDKHWTYIIPDYLSKAFAEARDQVERFAAMPERTRPTFHEIRGLGARIYLAQGTPEAAIQALMTHAHKRTTQIYLDRGAAALTDGDYQAVNAPLLLRDVLGTKG